MPPTNYAISTKMVTVVQTTIATTALATAVIFSYISAPARKGTTPKQEAFCISSTLISTANSAEKLQFVIDSDAIKWIKFRHLFREWQEQRGARSSITETSMMTAYQSIIGMGEEAVPLILKQLRLEGEQPDQWFWALRAITGENPVSVEDQGDFPKMAQTWIKWGEENYG